MEVPGCRSREGSYCRSSWAMANAMAMISVTTVILNSSLRVRINESKQLEIVGGLKAKVEL